MDVARHLDDLTERDWEDGDPDGPVRFGVVGLGGFARRFAIPALRDADYCELAALVSGSAEKADAWGEEFDARGITYDEFHDGAAAETYDAAYVVTPNARHLEFVETAADLGKGVVCEKPLEATAERAARLVEACEDAGVPLMTAYRMQTHPAVRRIRDLVRQDAVGDPVLVHGNFSVRSMRGDRGADHWRYDPDLAGGGALMDVGVYPLNTARFVLDADPAAVSAVVETPDEAFAGVDEHVSVQASFPDAVTASFTASFHAQGDSRLQVIGTEGSVLLQWAFPVAVERELTVVRGETELSVSVPPVDEVREEFDYFAHRTRSGGEIEPDGIDGLRDVETMMAAYEAAERGERVPVKRRR